MRYWDMASCRERAYMMLQKRDAKLTARAPEKMIVELSGVSDGGPSTFQSGQGRRGEGVAAVGRSTRDSRN